MTEIPIRPEALEMALEMAVEAARAVKGNKRAGVIAAIAAFCEAEGLTVEARFATYDAKLGSSDPQQRLVGPWRDVEVER